MTEELKSEDSYIDKNYTIDNYTNCNYGKCNNNDMENTTKKQATKENNNVTLEDVKMAIYTLRKEGVSVSVLSIRNKLGRGSNTTISKYLTSVINAEQDEDDYQKVNNINQMEIEMLATKIVNLAIKGNLEAANTLVKQNNYRFQEYRKSMEKNAKMLEVETNKLKEEILTLRNENETLKSDLANNQQRVAELIETMRKNDASEEIKELKKQNQNMQSKLTELLEQLTKTKNDKE